MKLFSTLLLVVVSLALARTAEDVLMDHKTINEKQLKTLRNSLDTNYRPCGDFYSYACHNWSDQHKGAAYNYSGVPEQLGYEVNLELMEYLEKTPETDMPRFVKLFKDFYVACRETPDFKLLDFMHWMEKEENMKWALLTPDDSTDFVFDWATIMGTFRKYGFNNIFLTETKLSFNVKRSKMYLEKPDYLIYNLKEMQMEEYNETISLPSETLTFEELWQLIGPFEEELQTLEVKKQEGKKVLKFHELPYPWMQNYLKAMARPRVINPNMKITIDMAYMEALDNFLQQYDAKFLARYVEIRFLQISHKLKLKGSSEHAHMFLTRSLLPMAAEWIYEQLHPELRDEIPKIEQMFENVVKNINKSVQMDGNEIIPQEFFEQLETLRIKVGYLPQENSKDLLESYYADLQLDPNNYYHNYLKILEFNYKLERSYIDYEDFAKDKEFFYKTPHYDYNSEVKPVYVVSLDLLIFPLALFRAPVYDAHFEDIFKQSSLATLMGESIFDAITTSDYELIERISTTISLHASYQEFFTSLSPEDITRYQQVFGFSSLQELKRMFFLNAIHYTCKRYSHLAKKSVNYAVRHLSDFNEAYDCKLYNYLKMF